MDPRTVHNTAADPNTPGWHVDTALAALAAGGQATDSILAEEAAGTRELRRADVLPTEGSEQLTALGIRVGQPVAGDPLFVYVTLPQGWTRAHSADDDRLLYVLDETGTPRVGVFYKAAFYDRKAHCWVLDEDGGAGGE